MGQEWLDGMTIMIGLATIKHMSNDVDMSDSEHDSIKDDDDCAYED
jgi:hypothetical protein